MNYLKELFCGQLNNTQQTKKSNNENTIASNMQNTNSIHNTANNYNADTVSVTKNVTEYSLSFCQFKYQRTGLLHPLYANYQIREWFIDGIKNNVPDYNTTFPVCNEKISNVSDYNNLISLLEKKYTEEAIKNKNTIKIIKTVSPYTFTYNGKDYDFTDHYFKIIINNNKNDYIT